MSALRLLRDHHVLDPSGVIVDFDSAPVPNVAKDISKLLEAVGKGKSKGKG